MVSSSSRKPQLLTRSPYPSMVTHLLRGPKLLHALESDHPLIPQAPIQTAGGEENERRGVAYAAFTLLKSTFGDILCTLIHSRLVIFSRRNCLTRISNICHTLKASARIHPRRPYYPHSTAKRSQITIQFHNHVLDLCLYFSYIPL